MTRAGFDFQSRLRRRMHRVTSAVFWGMLVKELVSLYDG